MSIAKEDRVLKRLNRDADSVKAWVAYDHTAPDLLKGYNVETVTDNSIGDLTVNFSQPMQDANYTVQGCLGTINDTSSVMFGLRYASPNLYKLTTSCRILTMYNQSGAVLADFYKCDITFVR